MSVQTQVEADTTGVATPVAKTNPQIPVKPKGLEFARVYTRPGINPLDVVEYTTRNCVITNPDGSVVFKMEGAGDPRRLVPARDRHRRLQVLPQGRPPRRPEAAARRSVRAGRLPHRAHDPRGRRALRRLLRHARRTPTRSRPSSRFLLVNQYGAFNSPVWFNCGLFQRYGIDGSGGNWAWDARARRRSSRPTNAYERPQCSACFIQAVNDDLMSIYDLVKNEARLFKYGSGTGIELQRHPRQAGEALRRRHLERA